MIRKSISIVLMCISIGLAVLIIVLSLFYQEGSTKSQDPIMALDDAWKITCHESTIYHNTPVEISNQACQPVYMEMELSDELPNYNSIVFYTVQSEVKVWLSDALIYEFALPENTTIKLWPPSMYHIVDIGNATKDLLKIEIIPTFSYTAGRVPLVYYGQHDCLKSAIIKWCLPNIACCVVLLNLTVCIFTYGIVAKYISKKAKKRLHSFAWCLALLICWGFLELPIKQLIFRNYVFSSFMLELSYFSIPILFSKYTRTFDEIAANKVCTAAALFAYLQFIVVQFAVLMGIQSIKLNVLMQVSTIFIFVSTVLCVFKSKPDSELRFLTQPFCLLLIGLILEIFKNRFITRRGSGFCIIIFCILFVCYYLYQSIEKGLKDYTNSLKENCELQTSLEKTRIDLMLSQIRPHFLYNTLTSIQTIIKVDPDYAYNLLFDFSRYLRNTINSTSSSTFIQFREELESIEAYIHIEKMRFGDLVTMEYNIAKDDFLIVPLSIQPIVENAVKHGLDRSAHKGIVIAISSFETDETYFVVVADTGTGFNTNILLDSSTSIGISNIKYRLEKQMNASVGITSTVGEGTTVTVKIPKLRPTEQ